MVAQSENAGTVFPPTVPKLCARVAGFCGIFHVDPKHLISANTLVGELGEAGETSGGFEEGKTSGH